MAESTSNIAGYMKDILFDPQISGGLLIALAEKAAEPLLDKLHKAGLRDSAIVGEVTANLRENC
jgi:hypothetical protein